MEKNLTKVIVDGQEQMVETRPLTMLFHDGIVGKIEVPDALELTHMDSRYHAVRVKKLHADTIQWFNKIYYGEKYKDRYLKADTDPATIVEMGEAATHVLGMVDLSLKMILQKKVSIFWKKPETHLHPRQQAELADLFVYLSREAEKANGQGPGNTTTKS